MRHPRKFIGIDLGAGSGRVMLGALESGKLRLEEVHRFQNDPVKLPGALHWDFLGLLREIQRGIAAAAEKAGGRVDGIGVDTWGVDFGLLDRSGNLLASPVHYRDSRTDGMMEEVFGKIPRKTIFEETGIQFLPLNTLYQLAAVRKRSPEVLDAAGKLLLMADLVHYFLTGRAVAEFTLATTSQMWNPVKGAWSKQVVDAVGVAEKILPEVVPPGSRLATLSEEITRETGLKEAPPVIASACHDTAAAIAAVPATIESHWGYLSSGTWSLLGVELSAPEITSRALQHNFTNEGGVAGTTRFLRNINGLWLVQECRKCWAREGKDLDYGTLTEMARKAGPARSFILPGAPGFFAPDNMPAAIRDFCRSTGQPVPESRGEVIRCALESLALTYRDVSDSIEDVTGQKIEVLHIVGGGSRNRLLNQLAADAMGVPVLAGPVEATVMGNILMQAVATGDVGGIDPLRSIVRQSSGLEEYAPEERGRWAERYAEFRKLAGEA